MAKFSLLPDFPIYRERGNEKKSNFPVPEKKPGCSKAFSSSKLSRNNKIKDFFTGRKGLNNRKKFCTRPKSPLFVLVLGPPEEFGAEFLNQLALNCRSTVWRAKRHQFKTNFSKQFVVTNEKKTVKTTFSDPFWLWSTWNELVVLLYEIL